MNRTPIAPPIAASLLLLLGACGGEPEPPAADEGETDAVVAESGSLPGSQAIERDPAPEVEAVTERASEEADGTWRSLEQDWEAAIPRVKDEFAELDETRLYGTGGDRGAVVALITDSYGIEPAEAERRLAEWEATL